jgi:hypothetical protein
MNEGRLRNSNSNSTRGNIRLQCMSKSDMSSLSYVPPLFPRQRHIRLGHDIYIPRQAGGLGGRGRGPDGGGGRLLGRGCPRHAAGGRGGGRCSPPLRWSRPTNSALDLIQKSFHLRNIYIIRECLCKHSKYMYIDQKLSVSSPRYPPAIQDRKLYNMYIKLKLYLIGQ